MPYSVDLRKRVIAAIDEGMSIVQASKIFNVCKTVIFDWKRLIKQTNSLAPKSGYQKGHSHKITDWEKFKTFAEEHKYCTSFQMRIAWEKLTGQTMQETSMLRGLKKIGFSFKKKRSVILKQTVKNALNL